MWCRRPLDSLCDLIRDLATIPEQVLVDCNGKTGHWSRSDQFPADDPPVHSIETWLIALAVIGLAIKLQIDHPVIDFEKY